MFRFKPTVARYRARGKGASRLRPRSVASAPFGRRLALSLLATGVLSALGWSESRASVPDPGTSGCGFPLSLPACPNPLTVLLTTRDAFDTPIAACSTTVSIVLESGSLDTGQQLVASGLTAPDGTVSVTFPGGISGTGSIHLEVIASAGGSGDVPLCSSGSLAVPQSCSGGTSTPEAGTDAGPWINGLRTTFPNPFRDTATVRFSVGQASQVRLSVHDGAGRVVAVLVDDQRLPGSYGVSWDGRGPGDRPVAAGVYFCRLEIGAWSKTRSMLRLR